MRKYNLKSAIVMCVMFCIFAVAFSTIAQAEDSIMETKIEKMIVKADKNGNDYVMFVVNEKRSLNGIEYVASTTVMVPSFSNQVDGAKKLVEGDTLKAVVKSGLYNDNKTYTLIQLL